ncbi:rhodanese-like domain-containing protein [Pseudanabaena mucicola]|uniref:Rhodanese-like domain-containing protein n=1 Tax=Pseudanabaena mucicola FACHB-723 TaxID=2692860 RepID=A0ABR8A026_9CYAN|nr:rhodanese-like domain-containing protein [Pseudanabaena mucicola]MBD2189469.1 rhodanese-like domain-containing protein [Pseudanabaena mucicola FACHB-723]
MATSKMTSSVDINGIKTIDADNLKQLADQQSVLLVDVREPAEHAGEKIAGSVLFPLSKFDPRQIPVDPNKQLVLYCRSGNRSGQAAQKLLDFGYPEVTHLEGGLTAWKSQGLPIKVNKNAPISMMRQVQIVAGSLVFTGTLLSALVSPWFLLLTGFVGAGLMFAGITDTCAMAMLLAKLPYNQKG